MPPTPGPMNPLQIQLFVGSAAGRRARFDRSPITFGRDPSNMLVVEDATISRRHGEIRFEAGHWLMVNHSENGTRLNRREITDKPLPIKSGDEVFVGGKLLFNITVEPTETTPLGEQSIVSAAVAPEAQPASKKKSRLWMGIGIYMGVLLLLVIFFSTLGGGGGNNATETRVPELTAEQIASHIRRPLAKESSSELRYRQSVSEARRLFARRDSSIGGRYEAYRMYQTALTYTGRDDGMFPDEDTDAQFEYRQVQQELIERVTAAYADATNRLNRGDNDGAFRGYQTVMNLYRDGNNPFYTNAQDRQNIASRRLGKKKLKKQ